MQKRNDFPSNGWIVAAIVEPMDPEATLKRFYREKDHIRLEPENDSFSFIIVRSNRVPDDAIRAFYQRRYPQKTLEIYSDKGFQIAGWAMGLIRERIK